MQLNGELRAGTLVTLSAILYGFLGFFGASLLNLEFSIPSMLFWRFSIAAAWMFIGFTVKKQKLGFKHFLNNKNHSFLLIVSSICYSIACTFYFKASQLTGTGIAMVIYFAYPLFVVLMVMLKEKKWIDKNTFFSLCLIIVGLYFLRDNQQTQTANHWGISFALVSALFFAGYVYGSKNISSTFSSNYLTFAVCFSNALYFLIFSLASHSFCFPSTFKMWFFVCALGIVATALPIQLMLEGLRILTASKASILSALEPTVTLFVGMFLLNESVSNMQMLGSFIILLSALYIQFARRVSD